MREKNRCRIHQQISVGFLGISKGCGVTHTAMMFARYLSTCERGKIAFVEMVPQDHVRYLMVPVDEEKEIIGELSSFYYHKVTYYCCATAGELQEIRERDYDYVVIDFGRRRNFLSPEYLQCSYKVVVCDGAVWKENEIAQFIEQTDEIERLKKCRFVVPFANRKEVKRYRSTYQQQFLAIPYNHDPMQLQPSVVEAFHQIL